MHLLCLQPHTTCWRWWLELLFNKYPLSSPSTVAENLSMPHCNGLYFSKMAATLSPIPHALLPMWPQHPSHTCWDLCLFALKAAFVIVSIKRVTEWGSVISKGGHKRRRHFHLVLWNYTRVLSRLACGPTTLEPPCWVKTQTRPHWRSEGTVEKSGNIGQLLLCQNFTRDPEAGLPSYYYPAKPFLKTWPRETVRDHEITVAVLSH